MVAMSFTKFHFEIEAIRARVRAMDFVRGTADEVAQWRLDEQESRANLAVGGTALAANEVALFDMLMEEAVPPALVSQIVAGLLRSDIAASAA
uniref:Uncharacterized protein n=1 Tax=Sphingomonas sp. JE1 TaxID=1628059 RepID=A0A0D4ZZK6_9SPHN|nr:MULTISPECIES: hypothetical protein [unclassified Sphingomonas]AJW29475.1 hypothetical protein pJE1_053 [Sphingomonas sp. JE1]